MELKIIHVPHLDGNPTPARCNRRTGEIWINDSVWCDIDPPHRLFILLHEWGHIALNTSDELAVDRFASEKFIQMGYSLNESVKALSRVLTGASPEHVERVAAQLERAKQIDQIHNKKNMIHTTSLTGMANRNNMVPWYNNTPEYVEYEELFGLGKAARERRKEKQAIKMDKKRAKNEIKLARADAKRNRSEAQMIKANAKEILAGQGIVDQSGAGAAIGSAIGGIFGTNAGAGNVAPLPMSTAKPKSNTLLYVGIGVAVLAVGGIVLYIFKRRNK